MKLDESEKISLQDAFKKFREKRMKQIQSTKSMLKRPLDDRSNKDRLQLLRMKFLNQATKYLGVPYAKKYHEKGSPDYDAPMYLDCCALVRKVLKDMKNDLGFRIGRWNQAYQFDTLPVTIENEEDMKPGDLVFISGTYFNNSRKPQKHDMVHVEIWLGDGEKTIGARYHKGRVQIHDSYKFVSKTYHSMKYHFKSIDTWLNGICRSFCSEHVWRPSKYLNHSKRSIFLKGKEKDLVSVSAFDSDDGDDRDDDGHYCEDKQNRCVDEEERNFCKDYDENNRVDYVKDSASSDINIEHTNRGMEDVNGFKSEEKYTWKGCEGDEDDEVRPFVLNRNKRLVLEEIASNLDHPTALELAEDDLEDNLSTYKVDVDDFSCDCTGDCCCNCYDCVYWNKEVEFMGTVESLIVTPRSCPSGTDSGQGAAKPTHQGRRMQNGTSLQQNARRGQSQNKPPSKSPSKQLSVAVSFSTKDRHKPAPKFYIGGKNGVALVEKPLLDKGWQRIDDSKDLSFYLKWVECKSKIDYKSFRAGEQLVNHIPNGGCLTSKTGLLKSLEDYSKTYNKNLSGPEKKLDLRDFYPETYKVESKFELDKFSSIFKDGETWICKPSGLNQGKGIYLMRNLNQLCDEIQDKSEARFPRGRTTRIASRYIENPLLLNGRKFDIRAYMLIASTTPYLVLYHSGYVRLACSAYSKDSTDLTTHLTNQLVQKKHPHYYEKKDDSVWTFEMLSDYIDKHYKDAKGLPHNWALTEMTDRIKEIMLICFRAVEHKLERKSGYFDMLGFDFLIDDDMKVWLLEVNVNPALFTNCESLVKVIPDIVEETVTISIEAFENKCKKKKVHPIESLKTYEILFDEERKISFERAKRVDAAENPQNETNGTFDAPEKLPE